jgi:hypothetical protein
MWANINTNNSEVLSNNHVIVGYKRAAHGMDNSTPVVWFGFSVSLGTEWKTLEWKKMYFIYKALLHIYNGSSKPHN